MGQVWLRVSGAAGKARVDVQKVRDGPDLRRRVSLVRGLPSHKTTLDSMDTGKLWPLLEAPSLCAVWVGPM